MQNFYCGATIMFLAFLSVYFWYLTHRESDKRQQLEALLEEERKYISTILDTASALVVMLDLQGKIVEFNRACEYATGYLFDQVKGKYVWDVLTIAEERDIFQSALAAVVTERLPITLETYWMTSSGDRRSISWTNTVLEDRDGSVTHVISTGIDISDRFAVEQSLRASEKQYRAVVNNSKEVIFQLDEWGLWTFLNPAWTDITGFSIDESLGTPFHTYIHPDDCTKCLHLFQSLMQRQMESCHCEIRYMSKHSKFLWLEVYGQAILDAYGNIISISGNLNDVSDRKFAEAALQQVHEEVAQSQKMLRMVLDLVPQAIWWKDRDSKFLGCNRNFARMAGVQSPSDLIGKTDYDFWTKEEADSFRAVDARVMNQNRAEYGIIEPACLHNSTTTVWLETNKMPFHDARGQVIGTLGTTQNISDRKLAQEVMQRQLAAMEATIDGIGIVNQNGEYIYVNQAYIDIYGYDSPTELLGKTWRELYYPDEIARFENDVTAIVRQNGRWRGEAVAKRKDGSIFFEELSLSLLENGNLISICRNICDRKYMEAALRQSEARFQAFMKNSPVVAFIKDEQSRNVYVNETFERAFNIKMVDLRGKRDDEWLPKEVVKQVHEHDQIVFSTGNTLKTIETIPTPNGSSLYWLVLKFLIDDPQGQPLLGGVAIDITEHKLAEEKIKAALQEKEVLLKEVHHRVKNNLQVIDSLFRHQCRHIKNQQAIDVLKECQNRVVSMALLHEKLYQSKSLSNIEFADYVKSLVANLFSSYNIYAGENHLNIKIEKVFLEFELALNCGLIINELLTNALKYAFPSGILGEIHIEFWYSSPESYNLIIRDNGVGLPANIDLEKVKTLGLKLVRSLVRQLDGKVEITSDRGTNFKISFPAKKCDINL
ncbi:PAS domain S-box protein [Aliterella atlantica]|uniref:Histidine kinase n=1 Tax=Aliterella atlantica CENA595 TaxID=1618023 RepID=A0A0D8ZPM3_9CYAN|nr:PAS domain S-box protein [Aliterella atlantica]KJH70459.1 hypothetical protein UH38_17730 [Aliterella atlantica CENA595]